MMQIGIGGNIGSGKTTVCSVFEMLEIPVFYADREAKNLLNQPALTERIADAFGPGMLDKDLRVDRKKLAGIVFNDPLKLASLNAMIHPLVRKAYRDWADEQQASYIIMEAAILFESGWSDMFDKTILVMADDETRIERVCKRDGVSREEVKARMNNQTPQEQLEHMADYIIHNDPHLLVIPQVLRIDNLIRQHKG